MWIVVYASEIATYISIIVHMSLLTWFGLDQFEKVLRSHELQKCDLA